MINISIVEQPHEKTAITLKIMHALPTWFSPPEDIEKKAVIHRDYPFFAAYDNDTPIGFVALKLHNKYTADIFNLGVLEQYHRQGIGRRLIEAVEEYCNDKDHQFLTVKTLDSSADYEPYERTRAFYQRMGFLPLEVFTTFWNEENPCLFMAKHLGAKSEKMSIKMIVTDLDGTLLRTDKTMSEQTKIALNKCRRNGIKVVYATGRGVSSDQVAPAELFDGRITMNGAVAKSGDTIIHDCLIPFKIARPLLIACDEHGMKITSEISGMHYSNFNVSELWAYITNYQIVDFAQHDKDAEKIYTPNPSQEDKSFIQRFLPSELYFVETADINGFLGQIMHKEATKSKAITALAQYWDISQSEILAFGDDYNDIEMLCDCGIGVAVANAIDEVKAVVNHICDANENDGVAKWLGENML